MSTPANLAEVAHRPQATFDSRELRNTLGTFVTGVAIITTVDAQGIRHGLTVNSFSSVSLDPPLVLWSQSLQAPSQPVFRDAKRFAVNVLAENQLELSNTFARGGGDKFAHCSVQAGLDGVPLIEGCVAHLECRKTQNLPGGDHMVYVGHVERIMRQPAPPLVFGGGRYLVALPHEWSPTQEEQAHVASQHLLLQATRSALELARELDLSVGVAVWGNLGPTLVQWVPRGGTFSGNLRAGQVLPLRTTATGLAFAAWLPQELIRPALAGEFLSTDIAAALEQQLDAIRNAGVAQLSSVQREGDRIEVTSLSAPVFDAHGQMQLALTVAGPSRELEDTDRAQQIRSRLFGVASSLQPSALTH